MATKSANPAYSASDIKTMEGMEHIRQFPARYLGEFDTARGMTHQIKEIIDNAVDEAVACPDRQHQITVVVSQLPKALQVICIDTGRGVPLDRLTPVFSVPRTSGKWGVAYGGSSAGVHGEGAKSVAAISKTFLAVTSTQDGMALLEMKDGKVVRETKTRGLRLPNRETGTAVMFITDPTFMSMADGYLDNGQFLLSGLLLFLKTFSEVDITFRLFVSRSKLVHLTELQGSSDEIWQRLHSTTIDCTEIPVPSMTRDEYATMIRGIKASTAVTLDLAKPLRADDRDDSIGFNIRLWFTIQPESPSGMAGSVNMVPINDDSSYHLFGLQTIFRERMSAVVDNRETKAFVASHYRFPMCGWADVRVKLPKFDNQTKDAMHDREFLGKYQRLLRQQVPSSAKFWTDLYLLLETDVANQKIKFESRGLGLNQSLSSIKPLRPEKYRPCDSCDPNITELFLTEGDSAGGSIASARDSSYQAVFFMGGKSLNAVRTTNEALRENPMFGDLIRIIGLPLGATNLSTINFRRIIIMSDADPDGLHIQALLLGFLYALSPKLFTDGRVYVVQPPLFTVELGKNRIFVRDERALDEMHIETLYRPNLLISLHDRATGMRLHNTELVPPDEYAAFCFIVLRLGRLFEQTAVNVTVNANLLESLVPVQHCLDPESPDCSAVRECLSADAVTYHKDSHTMTVTLGKTDIHVPLDNLAPTIRADLIEPLQTSHWDKIVPMIHFPGRDPYYLSYAELYGYMLRLARGMNTVRNKGLGAMEAGDLYQTCICPSSRTLQMIDRIDNPEQLERMLGSDPTQRKALFNNQ